MDSVKILLFALASYGVISGAVRLFQSARRELKIRRYRKTNPPMTFVGRCYQKVFAFVVEIDGFTSKGFSKVEGLYWSRDSEGRWLDFHNRITLTRGLVAYPKTPNEMQAWYASAQPRDVYIVLFNRDGQVNSRLHLGKCAPTAYYLSDPDNSADEVLVESIELIRTERVYPNTAPATVPPVAGPLAPHA